VPNEIKYIKRYCTIDQDKNIIWNGNIIGSLSHIKREKISLGGYEHWAEKTDNSITFYNSETARNGLYIEVLNLDSDNPIILSDMLTDEERLEIIKFMKNISE